MNLPRMCTFVLLFEHGRVEQALETTASIADFVGSYYTRDRNPSELLVVCGDSQQQNSSAFAGVQGFGKVQVLTRKDWNLPGEQQFSDWPVMFNLANIALKRVGGPVMFVACGEKILNRPAAVACLEAAAKDTDTAYLSTRRGAGSVLIPTAILFKYFVAGWANLATAADGTVLEIRKKMLGGARFRIIGAETPSRYTDSNLIAAIAFDFNRDRYGYGANVRFSNWT